VKLGPWTINPRDRVTISTRFGPRTGRAQPLLFFPTHVVLNLGGKHGTPAVADLGNIIAVNGKGAA
jgi:hypothetical protein